MSIDLLWVKKLGKTAHGYYSSVNVLEDGSVSEAKVLDFLDMSYDLIDGAGRKENK